MLVDVCTGDERIETGFTVVTLECAGILPCSEAQSVVNHIEDVWAQLLLSYLCYEVDSLP